MTITKYVTTTSFRPAEGRRITLPAGCVAVLYVFYDRDRAVQMNGSDDLVVLTETQRDAVQLTIDPDSGESWFTKTEGTC